MIAQSAIDEKIDRPDWDAVRPVDGDTTRRERVERKDAVAVQVRMRDDQGCDDKLTDDVQQHVVRVHQDERPAERSVWRRDRHITKSFVWKACVDVQVYVWKAACRFIKCIKKWKDQVMHGP